MIHLEVCLSWRTIVLKNNENCRIGTVNKSLPTKVRLENIGAEEIKVSENIRHPVGQRRRRGSTTMWWRSIPFFSKTSFQEFITLHTSTPQVFLDRQWFQLHEIQAGIWICYSWKMESLGSYLKRCFQVHATSGKVGRGPERGPSKCGGVLPHRRPGEGGWGEERPHQVKPKYSWQTKTKTNQVHKINQDSSNQFFPRWILISRVNTIQESLKSMLHFLQFCNEFEACLLDLNKRIKSAEAAAFMSLHQEGKEKLSSME